MAEGYHFDEDGELVPPGFDASVDYDHEDIIEPEDLHLLGGVEHTDGFDKRFHVKLPVVAK
jgi:hypothetical protein